jgi:glycosyltransferase involved in cell wall biosynthesis
MIDSNLIIAAAIRDNESTIDKVFSNIERFSKLFKKTKIIMVESDSIDNTINKLNEYKEKLPDMEIISLGNLDQKLPFRTARIATARNVYLDAAEKLKEEYQYLLIMDMDDICSYEIDEESILSNFRYDDWDMMTANQPDGYYDIWALRHEYWMPHDCWDMVHNRPSFMSFDEARILFVHGRQINIDENHPPIKVQSAFGGMGLIKIDSIKGARHEGITDGKEICEWVRFCEKLNEGNSNIFINPRMITSTHEERPLKKELFCMSGTTGRIWKAS